MSKFAWDVWHEDFGWIQALAPAAKRPRAADNEDETPQDSKVPKGKGKGKGSKGKGTGWQCGVDDHYQRDCFEGTGKPSVLPAACSSWRPSPAWPAPTPSQSRSWMPKPIEGGGEGKGKSCKGYKGNLSKGMQVDGDAAYIGQHDYDYYDCSYFQQVVGDLGTVAKVNPNVRPRNCTYLGLVTLI